MGAIYEAEQSGAEGFTKTVAIKILLPELSENKEFVSMFIGEARLVATLVHQNIVQIFQLGRFKKEYFIAMEYIDGIDLETFMARHGQVLKHVPVDLAVYITSRICRGLEYAHNKRDDNGDRLEIVHRDVSPRNLMITNEGEVKLTDFGVAKAHRYMAESLRDNVMVGKVPYMSPEQASYGVTDPRSDIFSLGAVLYELLTGVRVFERETDEEIVEAILHGDTPDPRKHRAALPRELVEIVMRCLERDPARRYQTAGELGYDLEYHIYSKGYGPTIMTLAKYAAKLFPHRTFYVAPSRGDGFTSTVTKTGRK
jgi:serine/threonine-protein kinase